MSLTSRLTFYRTLPLLDPVQIQDVMRVLQPRHSVKVSTSSQPDHSWAMIQAEERGEDPDTLFPSDDEEYFGDINPNWVHTFYKPGGLLSMDFVSQVDHLKEAVISGVPESIRGNFGPINLAVYVGEHDLWEALGRAKPFLFGRATLSFSFWGYSTPLDGKHFAELVFQVPEVRAGRELLEATFGPLQCCFSSEG